MNKKSPSAVLWDMDGVLVDSGDLHFETWRLVLSRRAIDLPRSLFYQTFGMNNTGLLAQIYGHPLDPTQVASLSHEKETLFRSLIHGRVFLLPGVREWLERFREWRIPQAVASSAPMENIAAHIDDLGIRPYFTALASGSDLPGKPAPDVFLKAAGMLSIPPQDCLVIEDSILGIAGAKSAGMRVIGVTTSHTPGQLSQADQVVDRLTDLTPNMVDQLFAGGAISE